jgi:hypothetical protein
VSAAAAQLPRIPVSAEHPAGYQRTLFLEDWPVDANGCSLRATLLAQTSTVPVTPDSCHPSDGEWYSPYDGQTLTNAGDVEIDHLVPLKEAWDSGAWVWSPEQRHAFATDPTELRVVSQAANQDKGDKDPSNWLPADADVCDYLTG